MIAIYKWLTENWIWLSAVLILMAVLTLTETITNFLRAAKEGLKQLFTPLGIVVFCILVIVIVILYFKVKAVIPV
jgi:hypothetical protein